MPRKTVDFDIVRKIGLALPGVEESIAYGTPVLKLRGTIMAAIAVNPSAEPGSLMVRMDTEDRDELLAADPDVYYVTEHYGTNAVLVRLSRVSPDVLRDLIGMAHKYVTRIAAPISPARQRRKKEKR
jgi:hypothetical protein